MKLPFTSWVFDSKEDHCHEPQSDRDRTEKTSGAEAAPGPAQEVRQKVMPGPASSLVPRRTPLLGTNFRIRANRRSRRTPSRQAPERSRTSATTSPSLQTPNLFLRPLRSSLPRPLVTASTTKTPFQTIPHLTRPALPRSFFTLTLPLSLSGRGWPRAVPKRWDESEVGWG